nr:nonstructural polyprotein [Hepelivirales sp.]WAY16429.1 nonstructural polyprotein [Hepelivirales sp.]
MPILKDLNTTDQLAIHDLWKTALIRPREQLRIKKLVNVPYNLNDEQISILESYLGKYIQLGDQMKDSSHPIAATLNYIANQDAVQHMRGKTFIDIGSDLRINEARHACVLVDSHRDAARYLNQATGLDAELADHINENIIHRVNKTARNCFNGAERCNVQAEYAIAVNSLLDVNINKIPRIMNAHGIKVLVAWLMLPLELIDQDLTQIKTKKFYKMKFINNKAHFAFINDMSFIYCHDVDIWRSYLTTTLLTCDEFDVVVEINKTYGPMSKLIFVRTPKYNINVTTLCRCIPLGEIADYVKVPNMRYVIANDFDVRFEDIPKIVVRRHIATNLYKFVCKGPDGTFSYERGATYMHGMTSRIVIGQAVVHEEADLNLIDYDDLLLSVIMLAALARLRRTKTYGKAMKNVDNDFEYKYKRTNFIQDLQKMSHEFKTKVKDFFFGEKKATKFDFNEPNERDMMMYTFEFMKDVEVNEHVKCAWKTKTENNEKKLNEYLDNSRCDLPSISSAPATLCSTPKPLKRMAPIAPKRAVSMPIIEPQYAEILQDSIEQPIEPLFVADTENAMTSTDAIAIAEALDDLALTQPKFYVGEPSLVEVDHVSVVSVDAPVDTDYSILNKILDKVTCLAFVLANDHEKYLKIKAIEEVRSKGFKSRAHAKISELMEQNFRNKKFDKIVEFGIAPGCFSYTLRMYTSKLYGYHYIGPKALKLHDQVSRNYHNIKEFTDIGNCCPPKCDLIVSDIGDEEHTSANLGVITQQRFVGKGGAMIFKAWVNQINDALIKSLYFNSVKIIKPTTSFSLNQEVYIVCRDYTGKSHEKNDWKLQLYVIVRRIEAMYEMYLSDHHVNQYHEGNVKVEFVKEVLIITPQQAEKFSREFDVIEENEYQELNKKIKKKIESMKQSSINIAIHKHNAVFGSGKSDYIKAHADRKKDLIVVPTKELKRDYELKGYRALTYYSAMISGKRYRNVFFDEIFMFPRAYMYYFAHFNQFENIYVFGDNKQIGVCDFKSVGYDESDLISCDKYQNNVSKRVPQDVCNVIRNFGVDCKTTNKQRLSIFPIKDLKELFKFCGNGIKVMTYRQAIKDMYNSINPKNDNHTIHERQGGNYDIVVWVVEEGDNILTHDEYIRVAYTRHYNALIIYGADNVKHTTMNLYNPNIELIADRAKVSLFDDNVYSSPEMRVLKVQDKPFFNKRKITATDASGPINKVLNLYGNGLYFDAIRTLNIPDMHQGQAKFSMDIFAKMDTNRNGRALLEYNTCRVYDSKDVLSSSQCLPGRYGLKTKILGHIQKTEGVAGLHRGLDKFLQYPRYSDEYKTHFAYQFEDINMYFKEYLEALNKKNLAKGELDAGFDEYFHTNGPLAIKYFMKKQTKFDACEEWFEKAKLGQGVNAWSKLLNLVFAAFARFYSARLKNFLKPGVFFQNGAPDAAMGDEASLFLMNYYKKTGKLPKFADNDFTEFDASQNEMTIEYDCDHLTDIGVTDECRQLYYEQRMDWTTVYPGFMVLKGKMKKQSGEIFTIDFNTAVCMAANGYMLDIVDLVLAQFKGDDSNIAAEDIRLSKEGREFLINGGMKPKLHIHEGSGEFTGYIQTPYGPYPDTIRRVAKAFSKVFKDEKDLDEFKLAMHDYVSGINNHAQQVQGKYSLMHYYNNLMVQKNPNADLINMDDLDMLEDYMFNFKDVSYDTLFEHKKDTITLGGIGGDHPVPYMLV